MKKPFCISLLMLAALSCQRVSAQSAEYFPEGTTWMEVIAEPGEPIDTTYAVVYEVGGDTIYGCLSYHKVLRNGADAGVIVREQEGCVWLKAEDFPEELMIYDFNWDAGEPIRTEYVRVNGEVAERRVEETAPGDIHSTCVDGRLFQYYVDYLGSVLCRVGRVTEMGRNACLLGYKVEEPVIPGLIYFKVLWLKRDGKTIFSSCSSDEWTVAVPGLKDPAPGDVDVDGFVGIEDVMAMVSAILGVQPERFVTELADLDGSGDVDVSDVMLIVGMILNGK